MGDARALTNEWKARLTVVILTDEDGDEDEDEWGWSKGKPRLPILEMQGGEQDMAMLMWGLMMGGLRLLVLACGGFGDGGLMPNNGCPSVVWPATLTAEEADAWAVLQDMCMARSNGPWKLIIECDSNSMIECLRGNMRTYGRWRNIMRACLIELQGFDKSEVSSYLSRAEHCC
nr:uncharacterized protein LOC109158590 [Ipomoea batatas]GMD17527.1 uncharacterized protein LOC109158590 [Ipomoea batatas]